MAHPQALGLGGVESLEEPLAARGSQAWTRIAHRDKHAVRLGRTGADDQVSRPFARAPHRLDRVDG